VLKLHGLTHSRFDPRNKLPWGIRFLFKTSIIFLWRFASASQCLFCTLVEFLPWVLHLATSAACGDHITEQMLAVQQSNLVCGVAHFSQSASTLQSRDTSLSLNFCNAWLKKGKETLSTWLFRSIRQQAGCKYVCSGGTSSDLITIKEAVFCNFNLTYPPCCLHPPPIFPVMKEDH